MFNVIKSMRADAGKNIKYFAAALALALFFKSL